MKPTAPEIIAISHRCAHCGLDVPPGLIDALADEQFCCAGCRAVYQTLHACGLDAFYRLRDAASQRVRPSDSKFESFDTPAFRKLYVREIAEHIEVADLVLENVSCAACIWLLERLPHVLRGVIEARLSLREAIVRVTWDARVLKLSRIARTLDGLGYTPHAAKGEARKEVHRIELRKRLISIAVAGAIAGNAMLIAFALYAGQVESMEDSYRRYFRWLSAGLGLLMLMWPGAIFFRSAWAAIRLRRINLDVPIVVALTVGGVAGLINVFLNRGQVYFDSLCMLVFLLLVGRFLQYTQQRYADDSVELLFSLAPSSCRIVRDGGVIQDAPVEALVGGDLIEVLSGETIPADGVVECGHSSVLQALLTGESMPVRVGVGAEVFGGAQNQGAALRIRVTSVGRESRVGKLMRVVERGVAEKPAIVQFADRVSAWFVVFVSLAAAGTFAYWSRINLGQAIDHTVALLIVTCPCVLGLATPVTMAVAIGLLARRDILIKSGTAIEKLATRGKMFLDKTGTLTHGRLRMVLWEGRESLRPVVARLEMQSQHPVARALCEALGNDDSATSLTDITDRGDGGICARWDDYNLRVGSPAYLHRAGVEIPNAMCNRRCELESSGLTVVMIALDDDVVALAALGDELRNDSAAAVARLRKMGWEEEILSGDANAVVSGVASAVGIKNSLARGEMTPEQKLEIVKGSRGRGATIMVGDGVNDAAALAAADVGIAVHGGAEASLAAADVYIATPGMSGLVDLVRASRRTMGTVNRNLIISLGYNLLAGALAAAGKMNPLVAAIIMPISSASVLGLAIFSVRRIFKDPGRAS